MRLGFAPSGRRPASEAVALAREAEASGFDEVWLAEDYCERGAFAVAGAIGASTTRVGVGLGVVNPWTRHPVLLAMETAALDEVCEGRAVLGVGASNKRWMQDQLGIPFELPITRLAECVEAVRDLLAGQHVARRVCGHDVDTALSFAPNRADLPIVMGVKGRRALDRAAAVGDGVLLSVLSSPAYIAWARQRSPQGRHGLSAYVLFAHDDDAELAREQIRPLVGRFLGVHGPHDITRVAGLDQGLAAEFQRRLLAGEAATDLVTDEMLDTFAVAGDTATCAAALRRFAQAGADGLVIVDSAGAGMQAHALLEAVTGCARAAGLLTAGNAQ